MTTFQQLRAGHIIGVVSSQGMVLSEFTGEQIRCHDEFWKGCRCRWRWNFDQGVWDIGNLSSGGRPTTEEFDLIRSHLTKKYGIQFWDNGYHDLDHFLAQIRKETGKNPRDRGREIPQEPPKKRKKK